MIWLVACVAISNIGCAVIAYGLILGVFTREFPYMRHTEPSVTACVCGLLFGVFGLIPTLIFCLTRQPLAWRWKPLTKEQRWKIFDQEFGFLGREYFDKAHG